MYTYGQLARALETWRSHADPKVRAAAEARTRKWLAVIEGMADGSLAIGSRTPVSGVPAWATLEVVTGGFATGRLLAERDDAGPANLHALGEGRQELLDRLAQGAYRIDVPEQGAIPVIVWLVANGHADAGFDLLESLRPWLHRLAFTPDPAPPSSASPAAFVRSVGEVAAGLLAKQPQRQVAAMNATLSIWRPLQDELAALLDRTVVEGRVGARIEDGWWDEARALARKARGLLRDHPGARRPRDLDTPLGKMLAALRDAVGPDESGADAGPLARATGALATHRRSRGAPGSAELAARAAVERAHAQRPLHHDLHHLLAARLEGCAPDAGLADPTPFLDPVRPDEVAAGVVEGTPLPEAARNALDRCVEGTLEELVTTGRIPSSEVLADVSPRLTSSVRSLALTDPVLRGLRARVDLAFRRRRSLLLVSLQHQVRLEELPWVAALKPFAADLQAPQVARASLESLALLAMEGFPDVQFPNPLIDELRTLAEAAGVSVPLTEELAADIFMGTFTAKFVEAAGLSCEALRGTVYARYYDLPDGPPAVDHARREQEAYAALCRARVPPTGPTVVPPARVAELADLARRYREQFSAWMDGSYLQPRLDQPVSGLPHPDGPAVPGLPAYDPGTILDVRKLYFAFQRNVAHNGAIIEQNLVLTTHGVMPLVVRLGLRDRLVPLLPAMCDRTWAEVAAAITRLPQLQGVRRLRAIKNAAYGWRQLLLWVSLDPDGSASFLARTDPSLAGPAFAPAWTGLERVVAGERFDAAGTIGPGRRFYGWSPGGPHWIAP